MNIRRINSTQGKPEGHTGVDSSNIGDVIAFSGREQEKDFFERRTVKAAGKIGGTMVRGAVAAVRTLRNAKGAQLEGERLSGEALSVEARGLITDMVANGNKSIFINSDGGLEVWELGFKSDDERNVSALMPTVTRYNADDGYGGWPEVTYFMPDEMPHASKPSGMTPEGNYVDFSHHGARPVYPKETAEIVATLRQYAALTGGPEDFQDAA